MGNCRDSSSVSIVSSIDEVKTMKGIPNDNNQQKNDEKEKSIIITHGNRQVVKVEEESKSPYDENYSNKNHAKNAYAKNNDKKSQDNSKNAEEVVTQPPNNNQAKLENGKSDPTSDNNNRASQPKIHRNLPIRIVKCSPTNVNSQNRKLELYEQDLNLCPKHKLIQKLGYYYNLEGRLKSVIDGNLYISIRWGF